MKNNKRGISNAIMAAFNRLIITGLILPIGLLFSCEDEPVEIDCQYTLTMTLGGQDMFTGEFIDFIKQDPVKNKPYIVTIDGGKDECYLGKYQIILVE